jgi:hypothetical protein
MIKGYDLSTALCHGCGPMAYPVPIQTLAGVSNSQRRARCIEHGCALAPPAWKCPATSSESTLHQLAPYIGKLKSTIARDLIDQYSKPGNLIVDPFSGSGTIPLEALLAGRRVIASDVSSYAATLTQAKLAAPPTLGDALATAERLLSAADASQTVDLRRVPEWVRQYFHPKTLKAAIAFARTCRVEKNHFLMACLLGILHHQRPGFLSYPSSHLVPYLRDRKYPRRQFPEMYAYRALRPRLVAKVHRAFRRRQLTDAEGIFRQVSVEDIRLSESFDAMITSPPYMNALDYSRDNRLRLWFLEEHSQFERNDHNNGCAKGFIRVMIAIARLNERCLVRGGHCVLVVGESVSRRQTVHPAQHVVDVFAAHAPSLVLETVITDSIPDIRRARRDYSGVKTEQILVFRNPQT